MAIGRRNFMKQALSASCGGAVLASIGMPQIAAAQQFSPEELMKAGPLGDMVLGAADAPLTIVEYASFTCSHCARFHLDTFPHVKKTYIESGAVRFIFREFSLNPIDLAAGMFARCVGDDLYFELVDILFETQRKWSFGDDPYGQLLNIARQMGYNQRAFDACLSDQTVLDGINAVVSHASDQFGVNSTPTFFFEGMRKAGTLTIAEFDDEIARIS